MKLILSALISALCWSCRLAAASADTHVYTFDVGATRETPPYDQLRPQEARMVLAQRVGVEYFHAIDLDDAESVKQINAFGRRDRLFSQAKAENVLVLVEGIDEQRECLQ